MCQRRSTLIKRSVNRLKGIPQINRVNSSPQTNDCLKPGQIQRNNYPVLDIIYVTFIDEQIQYSMTRESNIFSNIPKTLRCVIPNIATDFRGDFMFTSNIFEVCFSLVHALMY